MHGREICMCDSMLYNMKETGEHKQDGLSCVLSHKTWPQEMFPADLVLTSTVAQACVLATVAAI
jgi:hypothetical protein